MDVAHLVRDRRAVGRLTAVLAVWLALVSGPASAHRLAPSLLELRELGGGQVALNWKTPLLQPSGVELQPHLPEHCRRVGERSFERAATAAVLRWTEDCGVRGLVGERIEVSGLAESRTMAVLRIELADGRAVQAVLDGERSGMIVPARSSTLSVLRDYVGLGFEHILSGLDHVLFVLGLVLLVSGGRALVFTITAFTVGHSVTLSLAALGFVRVSTGLVEIAIAASILVLAVELARGDETSRLRRNPWAMTFCFGLLHGLGFAGALAEVGLPDGEIPLALLGFNVGIEFGQLLFVAVVLVVRVLLRPLAHRTPGWLADAPVYAIGSLAAFWCYERIAAWL